MLAFIRASAPPSSRHRRATTPRPTRGPPPTPEDLQKLSLALTTYRRQTNTPSDSLPTDSQLRRCEVAKQLSLRTLINRAGGHRSVQSIFNLSPPPTPRQAFRHRELAELSLALRRLCLLHGLPLPEAALPRPALVRRLDPALANRIAAFPGRNGYARLARHVSAPPPGAAPQRRACTREAVLSQLSPYQQHPRVLPRLCSLPAPLAAAIQRAGGAAAFAAGRGMLLERDLASVRRFAVLVRWLAGEVRFDGRGGYVEAVKRQAREPPVFPSTQLVARGGMTSDLARYGGRRSMATRLGFAKENRIKDIFMGPFSVQLAADVLDFAVRNVAVSDGSVGMPSVDSLRAEGMRELAEAVMCFGGEVGVGRRVGLVPHGTSLEGRAEIDLR